MSLSKMVDGRAVAMSAQEEAAIRAEWAATDAQPAPAPKPTLEDLLAVLPKATQDAVTARVIAKAKP